jgi:hypothetical protein
MSPALLEGLIWLYVLAIVIGWLWASNQAR